MGPGGGRRYKKVRSQKVNGVDFLTTHFKKLSPLSPLTWGWRVVCGQHHPPSPKNLIKYGGVSFWVTGSAGFITGGLRFFGRVEINQIFFLNFFRPTTSRLVILVALIASDISGDRVLRGRCR